MSAQRKTRKAAKPAPVYEPVIDLPALSQEEVAALRANIALNGVQVPIIVDSDGPRRGIIDGCYRKRIADELGYECPELVESGLAEEEKRALARALNLARRQLNQEQKRSVIADQLRESPERSNRWLAKRLGVSHHTVQSVRETLSSGGQIAHVDLIEGSDGKQYPTGPPGRNLGRSDAGRVPLDYYGTPPAAIEALVAREQFRGTVWEPACGDGRALTVLRAHGCWAIGSDLQTGVDFLKCRRRVEHIITNPPYYLALEFVQHAKRLAQRKIALLLQLDFLHGASRYELFRDRAFPLKTVYVFSRRLKFIPYDKHAMVSHAWFVWQRGYRGKPLLDWIDDRDG